uniref:Uncharacterized protein n=1 Tax=Pectobacterium carotovorum TaxID=554 RepID=A0A0K0MNU4_PECCA|nr:hypothetical protein pA_00050 [Pectobacterium carotovorum]
MISKLKILIFSTLSIIFILLSTYKLGGRAARKTIELKQNKNTIDRLAKTTSINIEVENEIRSKSDDAVIDELRSDWVRK